MTITFRVDDGYDTTNPIPAVITPSQLGSLRALLADQGERLQLRLLFPDYGDPGTPDFAFEARVCPLALASVSACFDHYPGTIEVLDEAQFRGRRVRVWRSGWSGDTFLALSSNPDAAPELPVADRNAYALLATLGLDAAHVGAD